MFIVKKTEYVNKTFRIPTELINDLQIIAQNKQISVNALVIQCCEYALANTSDADTKTPDKDKIVPQ